MHKSFKIIDSHCHIFPDKIARKATDRVIFGTDFPMWKQEDELAFLFDLGLTEQDLQKILHDNLCNILEI